MAGLVFGARAVEPGGNAAVNKAVAIVAVEVDFWVIGPALRSCFGIERDDAVESGGEKERAVYEKGCGLEAATLSAATGLGYVASVERPGDFEGGDIVSIDLRERGIAHAASVMAVVRPGVAGSIS